MEVSDFTPAISGCYVVDHKYYVKENFLYCQDVWGPYKWKIEINGFEEGKTYIRFFSYGIDLKQLIAPGLLAESLILKQILAYHLHKKGHHLVHSASAVKDGNAYLFYGRGGAYKTTLMMNLLRSNEGWSFLGDDLVILGDRIVYNFPLFLGFFDYRFTHLDNEEISLLRKLGLVRYLLSFSKTKIKISDSGLPTGIFRCTTWQNKNYYIRQVPLKQNFAYLFETSSMDDYYSPSLSIIGIFPRYVNAYSFIFPQSKLKHRWLVSEITNPESLKSRELIFPLKPDNNLISRIIRDINQM